MTRACFWCGAARPGGLTRDHVVPLGAGGADAPANVVLACGPCNRERGFLVDAYRRAKWLRGVNVRGGVRIDKLLRRYRRQLPDFIASQRRWADAENRLLGYSPSGALDLSVPGSGEGARFKAAVAAARSRAETGVGG